MIQMGFLFLTNCPLNHAYVGTNARIDWAAASCVTRKKPPDPRLRVQRFARPVISGRRSFRRLERLAGLLLSSHDPIVNHFIGLRPRPNHRESFSIGCCNWILHFPFCWNELPIYSHHSLKLLNSFRVSMMAILTIFNATARHAFIIGFNRICEFIPAARPSVVVSFHETYKHGPDVPRSVRLWSRRQVSKTDQPRNATPAATTARIAYTNLRTLDIGSLARTNSCNHPVATNNFPLSKRPTSRLGCIAWLSDIWRHAWIAAIADRIAISCAHTYAKSSTSTGSSGPSKNR